ncbi:MAG: leucine-rich repeat domain-containing protein [Muribaculaceae bacterium]|nr:leucine-rich repeat domain-containing protein [Muribaculaceae bacterium]
MRRSYHLLLLALIVNISAFGADFKVGDFKYEVLKDGTVEIKDAKTATGAYVIEPTVTDPKSGKSYTVSSIGKKAFKKSTITSVTIPESIETIGKEAFSETDLSEITIPSSVTIIDEKAFFNCHGLNTLIIRSAYSPLKIGPAVFFGAPLNYVVILRNIDNLNKYENPNSISGNSTLSMGSVSELESWFNTNDKNKRYNPHGNNSSAESTNLYINSNLLSEEFLRNIPNLENVIFFDKDVADQAINVFASLMGRGIPMDYGPNYSDWTKLKENSESSYGQWMPDCNYNVYFGLDDDLNTIQEKPFNIWEGIITAHDNKRRLKFLDKWEQFMTVAVETPEDLPAHYGLITPEESIKYKDILKSGTTFLLDSVYLVKPTLTQAEIRNIEGFINNAFHYIGHDYGIENLRLEKWANADILNKDLTSGKHRDDYERILKSIDRYFTLENPKEDPYHQAMQLAALCGLERWKEAAEYFPKVHRAVTENGKYYQEKLPYEITYMQDAINEHGYKAVAPTYKKATSKKTNVKSSDNESLIQFFMEAAINAGIEHYKAKKRKKEARELFYESMGLDKKGRPKKR